MSMPDDQAAELFAAARRDCVTYRILRRDAEAPLETTLFHAQQVAEKAIKAVLVQHGIVFRRTHDLGVRAPEVGVEEADGAVASLMKWASTQLGLPE